MFDSPVSKSANHNNNTPALVDITTGKYFRIKFSIP
jgi:hypothetical protein